MSDDMTLDDIIKKYGTSGISAVLRILHVEVEVITSNSYQTTATKVMADDLEEALEVYQKQQKQV